MKAENERAAAEIHRQTEIKMKEVADNYIATLERLTKCESELKKARKQSREREVILDQALQESTKQTKEKQRLRDAKKAADRAELQSKLTKEFKVIERDKQTKRKEEERNQE